MAWRCGGLVAGACCGLCIEGFGSVVAVAVVTAGSHVMLVLHTAQ